MNNITTPHKKRVFETLWEKEKMLVPAFSPFPTRFSTISKIESIFVVTPNSSFEMF